MNLGGLGIKRKTMNLFKPRYDQNEYWSGKGGKTHYVESLKQADESTVMVKEFLIGFLKKLQFDTVLDVACGYGRYVKIINDNHNIKEYHAVDISKDQIEKAKLYYNKNIKWVCSSIEDYKPGKKFDLVFGANILLHVKPEDIVKFVNHIIRLSDRHVIIMDMGYDIQKELEKQNYNDYTRCFAHDLMDLFLSHPNIEFVQRFVASSKTSFYYLIMRDEK